MNIKKAILTTVCVALFLGVYTHVEAHQMEKNQEDVMTGLVMTFSGSLLNVLSIMVHALAKMEEVEATWPSRLMSCAGTLTMLGGIVLISRGLFETFFTSKPDERVENGVGKIHKVVRRSD